MRLAPFSFHITTETRIRHGPQHLPNLPLLNHLTDLDTQREIARPDGLHQEQALLPSRLAQDLGLRRVHRERLLTQHVFASRQGQHHILIVVRVRRGHVDDVDVGVIHEGLVVTVGGAGGAGDLVGVDELGGFVDGGRGGDGGDLVGDVGGIAGLGVLEEVADEG